MHCPRVHLYIYYKESQPVAQVEATFSMDAMNGINPFVARSETTILSFGNAGKTLPYCRKKIDFPLATNKAFRSKNSPFRNLSHLRYFDRRFNYFYSYSAAANKEFLSTHSFAPGTSNLQNKYLLCGRRSLTSRAFALFFGKTVQPQRPAVICIYFWNLLRHHLQN